MSEANSTESINYVFDDWDRVHVLQFYKHSVGNLDKNAFCRAVKTAVHSQRLVAAENDASDGDALVKDIDRLPIVLLHMDIEKMQCDIEVLSSNYSDSVKVGLCRDLAASGPKAVLDRVLPLYIRQLDSQLKFTGSVFRYQSPPDEAYLADESFVASEIEFLITLFYPEMCAKK